MRNYRVDTREAHGTCKYFCSLICILCCSLGEGGESIVEVGVKLDGG